jgi:hypothetical protein
LLHWPWMILHDMTVWLMNASGVSWNFIPLPCILQSVLSFGVWFGGCGLHLFGWKVCVRHAICGSTSNTWAMRIKAYVLSCIRAHLPCCQCICFNRGWPWQVCHRSFIPIPKVALSMLLVQPLLEQECALYITLHWTVYWISENIFLNIGINQHWRISCSTKQLVFSLIVWVLHETACCQMMIGFWKLPKLLSTSCNWRRASTKKNGHTATFHPAIPVDQMK